MMALSMSFYTSSHGDRVKRHSDAAVEAQELVSAHPRPDVPERLEDGDERGRLLPSRRAHVEPPPAPVWRVVKRDKLDRVAAA
jgi:hypothetical protein